MTFSHCNCVAESSVRRIIVGDWTLPVVCLRSKISSIFGEIASGEHAGTVTIGNLEANEALAGESRRAPICAVTSGCSRDYNTSVYKIVITSVIVLAISISYICITSRRVLKCVKGE